MEIDLNNIAKLNTTSLNALEDANYFILDNKERRLLDKWKLTYLERFDLETALNSGGNEDIELPYLGELHGHGTPLYVNDRYPFPYLPPYIIKDSSALIFDRDEYIDIDNSQDYFIEFQGVDNSYCLFINNEFVGFSNISHAIKRFDITPFINKGINHIKVIVFKISPSSYLECQDKFRLSGIFRDVILFSRNKDRIDSYVIKTTFSSDLKIAYVHISLDKQACLQLSGFGFNETRMGKEVTFTISNPSLWSDDYPSLYELTINYNNEIIKEHVGLRKIEIRGNLFLVNNKIVKLRGVNRHSSTLDGYGESKEIMEEDIKLFKRFNINSVRTSHYPANQYFLSLCDKYGIYVISEADLETHGAAKQDGKYDTKKWSNIISSPDFYDQIEERELNNVKTNINHPSIIMWSLGNESGYNGEVINRLIAKIKEIDDRPIHYEGSFNYGEWKGYHEDNNLDVYSRMYPSIEYCNDEVPSLSKPFLLCEYVHAMGNSLGELTDYMVPFNKYDNFFGVFVWEWTNHYVVEDGLEKYGGDFNEPYHDGAFCVDGLVNLDRSLAPEIYELREAYFPVRYIKKDNWIYIHNGYNFACLSRLRFEVIRLVNGKPISSKLMSIKLDAGEEKPFLPNLESSKEINSYTINAYLGDELVSSRSIVYKPKELLLPFINDDSRKLTYILKEDGLIKSICIDNKEILSDFSFDLFRNYISNDTPKKDTYEFLRMKEARFFKVNEIIDNDNNKVVEGYIGVDNFAPFYKVSLIYGLIDNKLKISCHASRLIDNIGPLRFGYKCFLPDNYKDISYLGLKGESYIDRHMGNPFGLYKVNIDDNYRYIIPQAGNDHCLTRYIKLDEDSLVIASNSSNGFSFNYDCFDHDDYKRHRNEMKNTSKRVLHLDYKVKGVGTSICGPELNSRYCVDEKEIDFELLFCLVK